MSVDESLNAKDKILIRSVIEKDGKETVIEEYLDDTSSNKLEGKQTIITQHELEDIFDEIFPPDKN